MSSRLRSNNKINHIDNSLYHLSFSHCLGIGPVKFQKLMAYYKEVKKAYEASLKELEDLLGVSLAQRFIQFRNEFDPIKKIDELKRKRIIVLTLEDSRYPACLKNISDPPICLYVKGDLNNFNFEKDFFFGVVGTRRPSPYGQQITRLFSSPLAQAGVIIVSGMALGVDTLAHWSALDTSSKTIAVLGCGVDVVYPPQNQKLYEKIVDGGGVVISEFPPGHTVLPGLFVARNRLISGLSRGILVIEGTKKSGALITARYAALQGKEVFAPPVPLTSPLSEAPNILLKQGAVFVTDAEDILATFNLKIKTLQRKNDPQLTKEEKGICDQLIVQAMSSDELSIELNIKIVDLLSLLSNMEVRGVVEKNMEGKYQLKL